MPTRGRPAVKTAPCAAASAALVLLFAVPALAQDGFCVLGLSAAPDSYVGETTVEYGSDFDLWVIVAGPDAVAPLSWKLDTLDWAVLQSCCGGSPATLSSSALTTGTMVQEGDPAYGVQVVSTDCVRRDVITLARLTFTWVYQPTGAFYLGAAALGPATTCDAGSELLGGRSVLVVPTGITPAAASTWGGIKSLYRASTSSSPDR